MSKNDLVLALDIVVFSIVGTVLIGCAIAVARIIWGPPRVVVPDRDLELNVHDWNCDTGPWPHEGDCTSNGDYARYVTLARGASMGIGRLPGDPNDELVIERRYRKEPGSERFVSMHYTDDGEHPMSECWSRACRPLVSDRLRDEGCEGAGA